MHRSFRAIISRVAPAAAAALVVATAQPVFADIPLPIIDVVPQQYFTTTGDGIPPAGGSADDAPNNALVIGGTFTEPLFKGFSLSYDRIVGGAFNTALSRVSSVYIPLPPTFAGKPVPIPGGVYPGPAMDLLQNYRADYHFGPFNFEAGLGTRHRMCCPYASLEWHKGYAGLSYASPHFTFLNGGFVVLDITGNAVRFNHPVTTEFAPDGSVLTNSLPYLQATFGANIPNNKLVYTSQQAVTAIIPVDLKHGVRTATTFLWGALDYGVDTPYPNMYDVFIISATKQVNNYFGITANVTNVTQRNQGNTFPSPDVIHTTALAIAADFHIDFNHLINQAPRVEKGRSTQPGVPGGPGGPAPISPSQGGAIPSPAPSPSPSP